MTVDVEHDLIRECTLDSLRAAQAQGHRGGRPPAVDDNILAIALARQARGESVATIARHFDIGCSILYRALQSQKKPLATEPKVCYPRVGHTGEGEETG